MPRWLVEGRQAARSLTRAPGFAALAVLSLGLGLGVTTAVFTVVKQVLLDPLGFPEADRLVVLRSAVPKSGMGTEWGLASAQYFHLGDNAATLADIGAWDESFQSVLAGEGSYSARMIRATAGIHRLTGARPLLGRTLRDSDVGPGPPRVAVLSHHFWQQHFGADPGVVGRTLRFDPGIVGRALTDEEMAQLSLRIVGVLEPVAGMFATADIWVPMRLDRAGPHYNQHSLLVLARLADGAAMEGVRSELDGLTDQLVDVHPEVYTRAFVEQFGFRTVVHDAKAFVTGPIADGLWLVQAAAAVLLAVGWAVAANLLLARVETTRRDLAVRAALGARWRDIARHYAAVGALLTVPGAVLGAVVAWAATAYIVAAAPVPLPRLDEVALDGGVLAFLAVVAVAAAAALAVLPAWRARDFGRDLADAGRGATASRERALVRSCMVVGQVALTLVLVVVAGLFLSSFRALANADPGIDADGVATVTAVPNASHVDGETWWRTVKELRQRIEAEPGVVVTGASSALPLAWYPYCAGQGFDDPAVEERIRHADFTACASVVLSTPGWFRAMGIPVLEGRTFETADLDDPARASVVVSRAFAERFWPGESPIGKRISAYAGPWYTIVGVVGDVYGRSVQDDPAVAAYYPLNPSPGHQWPGYAVTMAVRTEFAEPAAVLPALRETFDAVDPSIRLESEETMANVVSRSMAPASFALTLLAAVAGGALVLAVTGLYGTVRHLAARRTTEVGVRMALGARVGQVQRMMAFATLRLVALGLVLGIGASLAAGGTLRGILFGVSPANPTILLAASALLILAAMAAGWLAARGAARTSPVEALRIE